MIHKNIDSSNTSEVIVADLSATKIAKLSVISRNSINKYVT